LPETLVKTSKDYWLQQGYCWSGWSTECHWIYRTTTAKLRPGKLGCP